MRLVSLAALGAGLYLAMRTDDAGDSTDTPRGIRNNNPGNIERGADWQGLADDQSGDPRFAVFKSPVWGIRAMARILDTYQSRHGLNTIQGIINRWAPPGENDSQAYAEHVAGKIGISATEPLPAGDSTRSQLIAAIIEHENGVQPYPDSLIRQGIELA